MYQCLKIKKVVKEPSNGGSTGRVFHLVTFLDMVEARTFNVYVPNVDYPPFDVGTSYELHFKPSYDGLNFLVNE